MPAATKSAGCLNHIDFEVSQGQHYTQVINMMAFLKAAGFQRSFFSNLSPDLRGN
jgi:hypothetical protein